jgi:hypothetical protein
LLLIIPDIVSTITYDIYSNKVLLLGYKRNIVT